MTDAPKTTAPAVQQMSPRAKLINEVSAKLDGLLQKHSKALPKNFNQTRFLQNCLTVLADTKDIEKCSAVSVARTMIKGAYLDLDFFRKECYAIPYGTELNFQTDYKGEIKLCNQYSTRKIIDIYAKLVREGDDLEIAIKDNKPVIRFEPKNFNDGPIIGAFAVCAFVDGGLIYDTMSIKEIKDIQAKYSKAPNSPAYTKSPGEMYKKIVLRRVLKLVSLKFDNAEQEQAFDEGGDIDLKKINAPIEIDDPFIGKGSAEEAQTVPAPAAAPIPVPVPKAVFDEVVYRAELKAKHPHYDDSYIDHLTKEAKAKW